MGSKSVLIKRELGFIFPKALSLIIRYGEYKFVVY